MTKDAWTRGYQETQAKYQAQPARERQGDAGKRPASGPRREAAKKS